MNDKYEKLINKLNIQLELDGEYEISDYDEFTDIYNKLESSQLYVTKNSPQSYLTEDKTHVEFDGDGFIIYLDANFEKDNYTIKSTKG